MNGIIENVASAAIIAFCKYLYETYKKQKKKTKKYDLQKENLKFYISLVLLYISFIVQIANDMPFLLRFIFGGIGGFGISEIAIVYNRIYQIAHNTNKNLTEKSGKKHQQKRIRHK